MDYYTKYELEVIIPHDSKLNVSQIIEEVRLDEAGRFALYSDGSCYQECKWYNHSDDLIEISRKYPEALLKLYGKGEDDDDLWIKYYKNGRIQVCKAQITIVYDDYDETKLKEF